MTLDAYLSNLKDEFGRPVTDAAFGALCGMSQSQVSRLRNGKSRPSFEAIEAIHAATGGEVSPNDWFDAVQETAA